MVAGRLPDQCDDVEVEGEEGTVAAPVFAGDVQAYTLGQDERFVCTAVWYSQQVDVK